jgi:hypothetical protein
MNGYKSLFLDDEPTDGDAADYKVIVAVFTTCRLIVHKGVFDAILQQPAVPSWSKMGSCWAVLQSDEGATIYNASFRPFQSPLRFCS